MNRIQATGNMASVLFGKLVDLIFSFPKERTAQLENFLNLNSSLSGEEEVAHGPVTIRDALAGLHYCFILLAAQFIVDPKASKSFYLTFVPTKTKKSVFEVKGAPVVYVLKYVLYNCGYKLNEVIDADEDASSDEVCYHVKQTTLKYAA